MIICYLTFINSIFEAQQTPDTQSALSKIHPSQLSSYDPFPTDIGYLGEVKKGKRPPSLRKTNLKAGVVSPYVTNYATDGQPEDENVEHHWGALSPYFISEGFGIEESGMPENCSVRQVHVLSRHGSRFPTAGSPLVRFAQRLNDADFVASGALTFLNNWSYDLGSAVLVPIGKQQLYDSGVLTAMQYGDLMQSKHKLVYRTTTQKRMTESALSFLEGAYGGEGWKKHANLELIIEAPSFNNTLAPYHSCPNSNKHMFGSKNRRTWEAIYLANKTAEFQKLFTGYNWTLQDTTAAQLLCPYETVAFGFSQFCELFNWQEWLGFDYAESVWFEQNCAFGAPTGRAQGIGWANELVRRITNAPYDAKMQSSENATLDSSDVFFPQNQNIYVDFTHDSVISSVMAALNFKQFSRAMPDAGPVPDTEYYSTSKITPFAARLVVEVIECSAPATTSRKNAKEEEEHTEEYIHFLLNQRTLPVPALPDSGLRKGDGWIKLDAWLEMMRSSNDLAQWDKACFGEYPTDGIDYTDGRPDAT